MKEFIIYKNKKSCAALPGTSRPVVSERLVENWK
jgi:hypothetical protein